MVKIMKYKIDVYVDVIHNIKSPICEYYIPEAGIIFNIDDDCQINIITKDCCDRIRQCYRGEEIDVSDRLVKSVIKMCKMKKVIVKELLGVEI